MNMAYAGGDISPVTPYETNDIHGGWYGGRWRGGHSCWALNRLEEWQEYSPPVVEEPESTTTTVVVPPIPIKHESEPVKEPVAVKYSTPTQKPTCTS